MALLCLGSFTFKDEKFKTLLCDKQWVTQATNDKTSKVIIIFRTNNVYEHHYVFKDNKVSYFGKWSLDNENKNIVITCEKLKDTFQVISLQNNNLVLNTESAGKKSFTIKDK